jgi:hypothetical protein
VSFTTQLLPRPRNVGNVKKHKDKDKDIDIDKDETKTKTDKRWKGED